MQEFKIDVIVIGAGHAGLCVSYFLNKNTINHIVFERGRIGETWYLQRWDSFRMNSANKLNLLPEQSVYYSDPDAFSSAGEFANALKNYSKQFLLPLKEYCKVLEVTKTEGSTIFRVKVCEEGQDKIYFCNQIIIASGGQNDIYIPSFAENISQNIFQIHASKYRSVNQLPEGNVLVVGSAQSGTQVSEDLVQAGKKVFLSTGKVGRIPRRYRGRDIFDWLFELGFYDILTDEVTDLSFLKMKNPQVSGSGNRGKTSSLQSLASGGVMILGRAVNADCDYIYLLPDASIHIRYADEFSLKVKLIIDDYIQKNNLPAAIAEIDPADIPDENSSCASDLTKLNLNGNNITSIIWTTGFIGDFNYLKLPVFNKEKMPKHRNGISEVKGLYFIGLPWLRQRKSAVIAGIRDDAEFVVNQVLKDVSY